MHNAGENVAFQMSWTQAVSNCQGQQKNTSRLCVRDYQVFFHCGGPQ